MAQKLRFLIYMKDQNIYEGSNAGIEERARETLSLDYSRVEVAVAAVFMNNSVFL